MEITPDLVPTLEFVQTGFAISHTTSHDVTVLVSHRDQRVGCVCECVCVGCMVHFGCVCVLVYGLYIMCMSVYGEFLSVCMSVCVCTMCCAGGTGE